jgi:hypothetical protein
MKTPQITKRDVKSFALGMLAMFLLFLIIEWDDFTAGIKDGFAGLRGQPEPVKIEQTK